MTYTNDIIYVDTVYASINTNSHVELAMSKEKTKTNTVSYFIKNGITLIKGSIYSTSLQSQKKSVNLKNKLATSMQQNPKKCTM